MRLSTPLPISLLPLFLLSSTPLASAQFGSFFDQMFGSSSSSNQRERGNVASDSSWYQQTYAGATCSNYLCPGTLACVDKPTHCPCAWPGVEEKFELDADGIAVCLSRGGRAGFVGKKVELARKGLL